MKTVLEIAKEIGASKQQVYRYIKKHNIKEVDADASTKQYSDADAERIKKGIRSQNKCVNRSTSRNEFDALLNTIEAQQETIKHLTKLLDQEQQLRMISEQKLLAIEEKKENEQPQKKHWWMFGA